jgi:hypothetical protein
MVEPRRAKGHQTDIVRDQQLPHLTIQKSLTNPQTAQHPAASATVYGIRRASRSTNSWPWVALAAEWYRSSYDFVESTATFTRQRLSQPTGDVVYG